jgi:hypothetical protein
MLPEGLPSWTPAKKGTRQIMAGQRGSENRKRQNRRTVRFDEAEFALTAAMADRAGLEWSSWAREALLNAPAARARPTPRLESQGFAYALGKRNIVGSNLHQLLKAARFGAQIEAEEITGVAAQIDAVCEAFLEAMGRPGRRKP